MRQDQPRFLGGIVDRIAEINAQINELKEEADGLRQALIDADQAFILGELHQAALSYMPGKLTTDWKTIARKFNPSRQLIKAHTTRGPDYYIVRISGISAK